jgi:hypothetical protein
VLDRVVLEVWAGQPVAYGVLANRTFIPRHATVSQVPPFKTALTALAVEQVKREQAQPRTTYSINASAFFDSKLGPFEVQLVGHEGEVRAEGS